MGHKQKRVKLGRDVKAEVDKEWREVDWRGSFESQTSERRLSRRIPILDNKYSINFLKAKNELNCC